MTAISPTTPPTTTTPSSTTSTGTNESNQLNENTFLQLLVAQMKYQDPLSPTDSTQFLTQTAQFTEVSTLQQIETDQQAIQHTNQLLAASGMVGRGVTYSTTGIAPSTAVATSTVSVGGNLAQDAPVGANVTVSTTAYNNVGSKVPLDLQYTRTADGWSVQASSDGRADRRAVRHHVRRDRSTHERRRRVVGERARQGVGHEPERGRPPASPSTWARRTTPTASRWAPARRTLPCSPRTAATVRR